MVRPSFIKSLNIDGDDKMTIKDWIVEIFCYNDFSCFIRRIGRFILRLIRWIPILWNQEEWDFSYIYDMIEMKMKELRKEISEDTWHTEDCVKEELQQIDECLDHLDKHRNWTKYIKIPETPKDWDEFPLDEKTGLHGWNCTPEQHEAFKKANEFETDNFNKFWEKFVKYHTNWWT